MPADIGLFKGDCEPPVWGLFSYGCSDRVTIVGKKNGYWLTHGEPELQTLLHEFHAQGWRIRDPGKYYKLFCPCGVHMTMMHVSPSGRNYALDKRKWLHRQECYNGEK